MIRSTGKGFSEGVAAAFKGLRNALDDKQVREAYIRMVAALFVVITWLSAMGIWGVIALTDAGPDPSWWVLTLYWALRIFGIILVLYVSPLVSLFVINMVFPLLGERLFYSALATVSPERAAELSQQPGLPLTDGLKDAAHRLALFFGLSILAFVFSLLPVVGSIGGPVLQTYLTSRSIGWEMLDPYFDKLGWRFDDQRRFVDAHRTQLVGFGLPITLLMMIPIAGPLIFGLAQAAAAVLVGEVLERPAEAPPAA